MKEETTTSSDPREEDQPQQDTVDTYTSTNNGHDNNSTDNSDASTLEHQLNELLTSVERLSATESIGKRNVQHRRAQSSRLAFSILDDDFPTGPSMQRAQSLVPQLPSIFHHDAASHLLTDFVAQQGHLYLSLWLLPPKPYRQKLAKEIKNRSLRLSRCESSAPFCPHVTIVGSIRCDTQRHAKDLGQHLKRQLKGTGPVPCRFKKEPSQVMFGDDMALVWSQSCIAILERTDEFLHLLSKARTALKLPPGEWIFPGPAHEPHYSHSYTTKPINPHWMDTVDPPDDFVATEAALYLTTPGTVQGVSQWREITRIPLL